VVPTTDLRQRLTLGSDGSLIGKEMLHEESPISIQMQVRGPAGASDDNREVLALRRPRQLGRAEGRDHRVVTRVQRGEGTSGSDLHRGIATRKLQAGAAIRNDPAAVMSLAGMEAPARITDRVA